MLAEPINVSSSICSNYTTNPNSLQSLAHLYTLQTGCKQIKSIKIFPTLQVGADLLNSMILYFSIRLENERNVAHTHINENSDAKY